MSQFLGFLQSECQKSRHPEISAGACQLRRSFFLKISRFFLLLLFLFPQFLSLFPFFISYVGQQDGEIKGLCSCLSWWWKIIWRTVPFALQTSIDRWAGLFHPSFIFGGSIFINVVFQNRSWLGLTFKLHSNLYLLMIFFFKGSSKKITFEYNFFHSFIYWTNKRIPKAVQRHTALACWIEKQVLECPPSLRPKVVDALFEIMHYLILLNNFFSWTSLMGAFRQR